MKPTTYDEQNREVLDKTPVAMPFGYEKPESLTDMIARMIRSTNIRASQSGKFETIEEADDFEVDEPEMTSPYEFQEMQAERPFSEPPKSAQTPSPKPVQNQTLAPAPEAKVADTQ